MPLLASHDAVVIADPVTAAGSEPIAALRASPLDILVLVADPDQPPVAARTTPWLLADDPPTVAIRQRWNGVQIAAELFGPRFGELHALWPSLAVPLGGEVLEACVRHQARAIIATRLTHLLPAAIAADHLGAALVFAPVGVDTGHDANDGAPWRRVLPAVLGAMAPTVLLPPGDESFAWLRTLPGVRIADSVRELPSIVGAAAAARPQRAARAALTGLDLTPPSDGRPLLTVAIPTYNRSALLGDTLASVLAQAARFRLEALVEVVVSDNASPDDTASVVATVQRHARVPVRSHRNERNRGVGFNVVRALELARGHFCCLLGDDDYIIEGMLPRLLDALQAPDEVVLVAFAGGGQPFPYVAPTPRSLLDVARDHFYHVGNFGLAAVRTDAALAALAGLDRDALQPLWPQTQLYFHAMANGQAAQPARAVPIQVAYSPLHDVLTTYTGRYLFDEGCMALVDTALRLAPHMPDGFLPAVLERYWAPRWPAVRHRLLTECARLDPPDARRACLDTIAAAIRRLQADAALLGPTAPFILQEVAEVYLAYAAAGDPSALDNARRELEALLARRD
jgi:hypothetical protein